MSGKQLFRKGPHPCRGKGRATALFCAIATIFPGGLLYQKALFRRSRMNTLTLRGILAVRSRIGKRVMKKLSFACLLVLGLTLVGEQRASAWCDLKISSCFNLELAHGRSFMRVPVPLPCPTCYSTFPMAPTMGFPPAPTAPAPIAPAPGKTIQQTDFQYPGWGGSGYQPAGYYPYVVPYYPLPYFWNGY